jgi:hypothetical protein
VFLREIAKRLIAGLAQEIPDLQQRIDHIFHHQLYGIAITELTGLLSRRSLYCSKTANNSYSITHFDDKDGNIVFQRTDHTWQNGRCKYCGASQSEYDRGDILETHAYQFIHFNNPQDIFNMKFDVIMGNPPYQLDTPGAGKQAKPIYNLFVEQAKKLNPKYLIMIIPSRWFSGGMGLDGFRNTMMNDNHITKLVDYINAKDCFPENSISGGVCYFKRERDVCKPCEFISVNQNEKSTTYRMLNEFPVLVRYNEAISIIHKINSLKEQKLNTIISPLMPFGLSTNYRGTKSKTTADDLLLYASDSETYINPNVIKKGNDLIGKYKVMLSKTSAEHAGEPGKDGKFRVFTSSMKVINPQEICTHSYFIIGSCENKSEADNILSYLQTKFVRFLVLQSMSSINLSKLVFSFVPMQDFSKTWTDEMLNDKYHLSTKEISFIDSMINPI